MLLELIVAGLFPLKVRCDGTAEMLPAVLSVAQTTTVGALTSEGSAAELVNHIVLFFPICAEQVVYGQLERRSVVSQHA